MTKQPPYASNFERLLYLENKAHMDANTPKNIRLELKQIFGMGAILFENGFTSVNELRSYLQQRPDLELNSSTPIQLPYFDGDDDNERG